MLSKYIKPLLLTAFFLTLLITGCNTTKIGPERAKEIALEKLEAKYKDSFEVMSLDEREGHGSDSDDMYAMTIHSENLDDIFPTYVTTDGSKTWDKYEMVLYGPKIIEEIHAVQNEDGWKIKDGGVVYAGVITDDPMCDDLRDYVTKQVSVKLYIEISDNCDDRAAESMYQYMTALNSLGYSVYANADYQGGKSETVYDTYFSKEPPSKEKFIETIDTICFSHCRCDGDNCKCSCKAAETENDRH